MNISRKTKKETRGSIFGSLDFHDQYYVFNKQESGAPPGSNSGDNSPEPNLAQPPRAQAGGKHGSERRAKQLKVQPHAAPQTEENADITKVEAQPISQASAAAFAELQIRDEVVRENPYLLVGKFIGRAAEQNDFSAWLKDVGGCRRMLCVCDYGGAGKTALVWHWLNREDTRQARADLCYREYWATFYARDYGWRSFTEGLARRLGVDVPEQLHDRHGWDEMLANIIERLKEDRWLLVLDGLEREMASFASEGTLHMDSEDQDARKERGEVDEGERFLQSRQFGRFMVGLLATRAKVLVTSRTLPEDFWTGSQRRTGVEEYQFREMSDEDAMKVWHEHSQKFGNLNLMWRFFRLIGHHPQVISIVAAALQSSDYSTFEDWIGFFSADLEAGCFEEGQLKTTLRHRWLELATSDLVKQESKAWILLCHIIARTNASSVESLKNVLVSPGNSPFTAEDVLIEAILKLQKRNLLGYDSSRRLTDVHPVIRSHVGKYLIRMWREGKPGTFAESVLESLRKSSESGDAFLRLLAPANLDEAAAVLDQMDPVADGAASYAQSFAFLQEYFPKGGSKPFLEHLPSVSLRKLQASVLFKTAQAASATGDWEDATILRRRAKLAFDSCGELEKAEDCQRAENWQRLYGGSLFECERDFLRLVQTIGSPTGETDRYWLALSLAIRNNKWAMPFLNKIGPGPSRWTKQTVAEAYYYLDDYRKVAEILTPLIYDPEPAHPVQLLWELVTLGMARLRLGERSEAATCLDSAQKFSRGFSYRIVLLFSQSSYGEYLFEEAEADKKAGRITRQRTQLEEAGALFARTMNLDRESRFQIPMTEAHLGLARVSLALGDRKAALGSVRKSLEIGLRGQGGFSYDSGFRRAEKFLRAHFKGENVTGIRERLSVEVSEHEADLSKFMKRYLNPKGDK